MKQFDRRALVVLISATGLNILNGMLYTWSSISKYIISEWGWSSKQASLPYTVHTIFFVTAMVIFGRLMDKKGPKAIATWGSILLGLGFILSGFTKSPIITLITIGIIVGSGIGMHTVVTAPTAIKWFSADKKGMITGIVASGAALSSLIYSPIGNYLLTNVGINKTFIFIGVSVLVLATLLSQLLINPDNNRDKNDSNKLEENKNGINHDWKFMLKDINFYKLWIMKAFSAAAGLMIISHMATIANVQANIINGSLLIIIMSIFNSLGRVIGGAISDKIGRINFLRIAFIVQATNMALFNNYTSFLLMFIGAAIAGFCYGTGFSVFPATISDKYGAKNYGQNYGIMFTAWGLGGIIGPMTGAIIYDTTSKYTMAYIIAFILLCISTIITFTFKNHQDHVALNQ